MAKWEWTPKTIIGTIVLIIGLVVLLQGAGIKFIEMASVELPGGIEISGIPESDARLIGVGAFLVIISLVTMFGDIKSLLK